MPSADGILHPNFRRGKSRANYSQSSSLTLFSATAQKLELKALKMQTNLFSVSKIFTERLLRIPDFQRGYAWTHKQLKDFWNDLVQLPVGKNHYIGVLTLEDVPESIFANWEDDAWIISSKSYAPYFVVDGQQRLTTTVILIQAITERILPNKKLNFSTAEEIRKKFIWDSKDDGISRSYVFGYERDNPSYEYLKTKIFNEPSQDSSTPQETIYTHNLQYAKKFFSESLSKLTEPELELIFKKITQNFLFNIYAISEDIDVFVAFETMNNRGKALSHLELLKNRLIYLSTKFDVDAYEKNKLRRTVNEAWKSIYHQLGRNKANPLDDDLFLRNHFLLYFGPSLVDDEIDEHLRFRMLHRGYRHDYKDYLLDVRFSPKNIPPLPKDKSEKLTPLSISEIYDYSLSLKLSVETWYKILNPQESDLSVEEKKWLDKLNRLAIEPVAPIILAFFQSKAPRELRVRLLKILEQFLFYVVLVRNRYLIEYNDYLFLEFSYELSSKKTTPEKVIVEIEKRLESAKSNKESAKVIENAFRNSGYYSWKGILT